MRYLSLFIAALSMLLVAQHAAQAQWQKPPDTLLQIKLPDNYRPYMHMHQANVVLGSWSVLSMGVGAVQLFSPNPFTRAFGMQQLAWGAIDGGIAWYGHRQLHQVDLNLRSPEEERKRFRKILLVNTLLDVGYLGLGWYLMRHANPRWHGHGAGIVAQGGFLLLFDGFNVALTF